MKGGKWNMKAAKLGAIFMISVMTLAGLGVAYAHWMDEIYIEATVDMGRLGFGFVEQSTNDPGPNYEDPEGSLFPTSPSEGTYDPDCPTDSRECSTDYPPWPDAPKNVAKTDCVMSEEKYWHDGTLMEHTYTDAGGDEITETCYDLITVTLTNVYPNYAPNLYFYIANAGCVPVDILGHWLIDDGIPGNGFADGIDEPGTWFYMELGTTYQIDLNDDGKDDIEMCLFRLADDPQLDPCDRDEYGVGFHILQPFPQCDTLNFELKLYGVQWNWPVLPPYTPVDPNNPDLPQIP
jgi:hypothetical protein